MSVLLGGLQALLLCLAALGYGAALSFLLADLRSRVEKLAGRFALGLGVVILLTAAGGWLRLWGPWFHHAVVAGGIVWLAARPPHNADPGGFPFSRRVLFWASPALVVLLFYAAFPPTFYDALLYHLGLPAYYLQVGGFAAWTENLFSALPQNAEMLNLLLLSGGSIHGVKFFSLAVTLALLLVLADWAKTGGLSRPWLPALIFIAIPEAAFLAATEKNDMLMMLFLLLAARRLDSPIAGAGWRVGALAGLFLGLASGVKWQGLIYAAALLAAHFFTSRDFRVERLRRMALIAVLVAIMVSPWLARNLSIFADPVHPYGAGFFPASAASQEQAQHIQEGIRRGQGLSPAAILLFFQRLFLEPYSLGLTHVTGVLILLLLPLLVFSGAFRHWRFPLASCAIALPLLLVAGRVPRYFLPLFLLLSLPLAAGWEGFLKRIPRFRRLAGLLLGALVLVQAVQAVSLLERLTLGGRFVAGRCRGTLSASTRYLEVVPYYRAAAFINSHLDARTLTAFVGEERSFYVNRPFLASSQFDRSPVLDDFAATHDFMAWVVRLRHRGITHLLYCPSGLRRWRENPAGKIYDERLQKRLEACLSSWAKLYDDGRYSLYRRP